MAVVTGHKTLIQCYSGIPPVFAWDDQHDQDPVCVWSLRSPSF